MPPTNHPQSQGRPCAASRVEHIGGGVRVLVCGGRNYEDRRAVGRILAALHAEQGIACIIQGGARGADNLARNWGSQNGIPVIQVDAQWQRYGKRAGPIRNGWMLTLCKPDLVIAFPGGFGTLNMIGQAEEAGIETMIPIPFADPRFRQPVEA